MAAPERTHRGSGPERGEGPDVLAAALAGADDDAPAFTMLRWRGDEAVDATWSRRALLDAARDAAGSITAQTDPGDRVVIAAPPGLDFIAAFLGCLGAGRIAVPAPFPGAARARAFVERIAAVTGARLVATEALAAAPVDLRPAAPDAIAYLQFTSGSTQAPRGAAITHGALSANLRAIGATWDLGPDDRGVFWLPPFHDMGLVGAILTPLAFGFPATLMHPAAFLQKPHRWLARIAQERATFSGAPNFAYDLCVDRTTPAQRAALDLSSWRVAVNGAEPVLALTLRRFAGAFAGAGFRADAFAPGYGLAETVLFATARRRGSGPAMSPEGAVSCGAPAPGTHLRIVDEARGVALAEGETGAVWIAGPSLARGYWNDPAATADVFDHRLPGEPHAFLRTGDIGRLRAGDLFVCGRAKDVIVRGGRNLHAADLEQAIALRLGRDRRTAAFAAPGPAGDRLVIVQEARAGDDLDASRAAIVDALGADCDAQADAIVFTAPGGVPVTTSGKVARAAARDAWRTGALPAPPHPTSETAHDFAVDVPAHAR
ncbi:MAG: AMP-binding protein [Hyphomonadaceae bacterium]|nr:AMP-binding protein [Hyphomonadaceae bacterium]